MLLLLQVQNSAESVKRKVIKSFITQQVATSECKCMLRAQLQFVNGNKEIL